MALTVNSNIASLTAQRNLGRTAVELRTALERLSSGLRINRAGDDAAGLAISEALRAQIRGLQQATRNANDGLSLVGTAEGALNESTNIIQRIRELSVQAANGTNSDANRASLQDEIDQLIQELDRIGNTTQFNGRNLLDGTFVDVSLHVGANRNQTLDISIDDVRASTLGAVAIVTGSAISTAANSGADLADFVINGVAIDDPLATDDTLSTTQNDASAIALVAAINRAAGQSGVSAEANGTVYTGGAIAGGTLDGTNYVEINGVRIQGAFLANDSDGALREAINDVSNQTGVIATIDASNQLVLTAADSRNIAITAAGTGATITGLTPEVYHGSLTLYSDDTITTGGTDVVATGFTASSTAVDPNTAINRVDITTAEGAQDAIRTADFALNQITSIRASLGAITNRLESTVSNLQMTAENLSASESRIRDADFAVETAALTRAQILQQAGTSILAQANLVPQAALALLQG
ncbi:flagellin [Candidatus Sumerlaeota bacterium]|nr:flagellin [Candidatus Sumerlaeota bacterium]